MSTQSYGLAMAMATAMAIPSCGVAAANSATQLFAGLGFQRIFPIKTIANIADELLWLPKGFGRNLCASHFPVEHSAFQAIVDSEILTSSDSDKVVDFPPVGCTRIKLELNKPLGIAFEEVKPGNIIVVEVVKDGNADKSGLVDIGDQLIATSAIVYDTEDYYQGVKVRKGMQIVRLSVRGEKFETVMAAIGTHPAHVKRFRNVRALQLQEKRMNHLSGEKLLAESI